MKIKTKFLISGILVIAAGFLTYRAWVTEEKSSFVAIMILATVFFLTGVTILIMSFKE